MVHIISKREGPRREDVKAKRLIQENWGTIEKLADRISGGAYSASKVKQPMPEAKGLIINIPSSGGNTGDPEPHLRISSNGRVIVMDLNTGRQLHFLGQIAWRDGRRLFLLATRENGFVSPVDDSVGDRLTDLDGTPITTEFSEDHLVTQLNERLELA